MANQRATKLNSKMTVLVHVPTYTLYSILIALGGLLFGLDTGCIGPITTMPQFVAFFGELSSTVHGLVVSSILIPAALASFFSGTLSDAIGRTKTVGIGALGFGIGCALEAAAQNLGMLFAGRIITGIGEGLFISQITVYICEIAPPKERGMLCSIQQFLISFSICAGYFICYGTVTLPNDSTMAWRLPFIVQAICSFIYAATTFGILRESPRWLASKGRIEEAEAVWQKLGISSVEVEKNSTTPDIISLVEALGAAPVSAAPLQAAKQSTNKQASALDMFKPGVVSRTMLGASLMAFQQFSGIDGVLYYAPLLFQAAGLSSSTASFLASGITALLMLLITIPAFLYADRWGRRTSALTGAYIIAASMLTIGSLYAADAVHADYGAGRWVVIVLIYIFALAFSATWAVGLRTYVSEIQPEATRAPATSLGQSFNWIANWIVAFTTPILLSKATYSPYFLFGGCAVIAVMICVLAMPETRGRSLEEIDREFERRKANKVLNVTGLSRHFARRRKGTIRQVDEVELQATASASSTRQAKRAVTNEDIELPGPSR